MTKKTRLVAFLLYWRYICHFSKKKSRVLIRHEIRYFLGFQDFSVSQFVCYDITIGEIGEMAIRKRQG